MLARYAAVSAHGADYYVVITEKLAVREKIPTITPACVYLNPEFRDRGAATRLGKTFPALRSTSPTVSGVDPRPEPVAVSWPGEY